MDEKSAIGHVNKASVRESLVVVFTKPLNARIMRNENQGHTSADRQQALPNSGCPNALGIVRHSTLWLKLRAVAQVGFPRVDGADHLRCTKFVGLRDDNDPRQVPRET